MISLLVVALVAAVGGVVALSLRLTGIEKVIATMRAERDEALQIRDTANLRSLDVAKAARESHDRQAAVLAALRGDIAELEEDLDACATPGARRDRLRSLLSKADAAADVAASRHPGSL